MERPCRDKRPGWKQGLAIASAAAAVVVVFATVSERTSAARERVKAPEAPKAHVEAADPIQAGKYLIMIGGCNDCHTPGYDQKRGRMPEADWLTGSPVGFKGPWGTSYPANLRLTVGMMSEDKWVEMMRTRQARPPMPWLAVNAMSDDDLRAVYKYIRSLGPKGEKAPDYLPPGAEPKGPVVTFPAPPEE